MSIDTLCCSYRRRETVLNIEKRKTASKSNMINTAKKIFRCLLTPTVFILQVFLDRPLWGKEPSVDLLEVRGG